MQSLRNMMASTGSSPSRPTPPPRQDDLSRSRSIPLPKSAATQSAAPVGLRPPALAAPTLELTPSAPNSPLVQPTVHRHSMPANMDSSGVSLLQTAMLVNSGIASNANSQASSANVTPDQNTSPLQSQPEKPGTSQTTLAPTTKQVLLQPSQAASPLLPKSSLKKPRDFPAGPPPDFNEHMARASPLPIVVARPAGENESPTSAARRSGLTVTPPPPEPPVTEPIPIKTGSTTVTNAASKLSPSLTSVVQASFPSVALTGRNTMSPRVVNNGGLLASSLQESVICASQSDVQSIVNKSDYSPEQSPRLSPSNGSLNMSNEDLNVKDTTKELLMRTRSYKITTKFDDEDDFTRSVSLKVDHTSKNAPIFNPRNPAHDTPSKEPSSRNIFDFLRKSKHEVRQYLLTCIKLGHHIFNLFCSGTPRSLSTRTDPCTSSCPPLMRQTSQQPLSKRVESCASISSDNWAVSSRALAIGKPVARMFAL